MKKKIIFHDMKMEISNNHGGETVYYYGEIMYITCNNPECVIHFTQMPDSTVCTTLKYLEKELPDGFFRCNDSTIVNLCYYREYGTKPKAFVLMDDGETFLLSQRKIGAFRKREKQLPRISPPCGGRCYACGKNECRGRAAFCRRSKTGDATA